MRLGSGEHYGWEEPRSVRLVHVLDGAVEREFAWLQVPAGAKGGPLDVVVRPRLAREGWRVPGPGQRLEVEAWQLTERVAADLQAQVEAGPEPIWTPPAPAPDLWLWVEQPQGGQEPRPVIPRRTASPSSGPAEESRTSRGYDGISFLMGQPVDTDLLGSTWTLDSEIESTRDIRLAVPKDEGSLLVLVGDVGRRDDGDPPLVRYDSGTAFEVTQTWRHRDIDVATLSQVEPRRQVSWGADDVRRVVTRHLDATLGETPPGRSEGVGDHVSGPDHERS